MPGTTNRLADDQSFRQGTAVVRAVGTDRKHLLAAAHQKDGLAIDLTEERRILRQAVEVDANLEIRSGEWRCVWIRGHGALPRSR
jgi:hypothetical protein